MENEYIIFALILTTCIAMLTNIYIVQAITIVVETFVVFKIFFSREA